MSFDFSLTRDNFIEVLILQTFIDRKNILLMSERVCIMKNSSQQQVAVIFTKHKT